MNGMSKGDFIFEKEMEMWVATCNRDVTAYRTLVAEDAVMICGGYRCLGSEYAGYIKDFDISSYEVKAREVIFEVENMVQIHYVIDVKTFAPEASDLSGLFHVVSLWKKINDDWKLFFNIDSRIIENN